ncbi:interference hedgehog isoform X2 [Teleopsis dalmanni]|uniref:interference hedgehog isoform X2 n=1 Tax=Teleopsis dalmanni TaxID=139649 RepID=UPI0018CFDB91|nr:interference hedgehog isoform X2 [Teleopsis dalmanni]
MTRLSSSSMTSRSHLINLTCSYICCTTFRLFSICLLALLLPLLDNSCSATQPTSLGVHIVRSPESAVAPKGDEVVFECELNLNPERLEWRFRHTSSRAADANNFRYLRREDGFNITNDDRTFKLRIFVAPENLGDYQCVAWFGSAAIASTSARLTLVSISIDNSNGFSRNAIRWSIPTKNCVLIRCGSVTSNPPAVWSFYRNGEKFPQTEILPSSNGALILNSVTTKDSGNYTCSAMNAITGTELTLPQRIDLRVDYMDRMPPYFPRQPPKNVTARPGETIVLECPGVGSPKPEAVWSSPNVVNYNNNRTKMLPYGLQITDVKPEDQGTYICRLDNGIAPALVHTTKLVVLERPKILRGPATTLTNENSRLELECSVTGNPHPDIYWLINGEDTSLDNETFHEGRRLVIKNVEKRHAGIVQCFAKNEVGETSEANLLQVNPKQIGETGSAPLGNVPVRQSHEHSGNKNKGRRKHKVFKIVPPSRPNVTRLSDDSVMLRWHVPKNDGLAITFFKVQYRMLGGINRTIPRETWQTTYEDIKFGKRDRNNDGVTNFTSSVTGLKPDRFYRFRIIAVYSNNDNKEGNISAKFFLQRADTLGPTKSKLPTPELAPIEPISDTAVVLHWTLQESPENMVDGFYAYYRHTSSAGDYMKATVDGMHTRKFKIDTLDPDTMYEFKLQSFNALAASDFSTIIQGKTKKQVKTMPTEPPVVTTTKANEEDNSIYPVIAGAAGGGILLLLATIAVCLCMKRRINAQTEDEDKPQLDHLQADFVVPGVLGVNTHHKSGHRLNGVMPRMNITPNPLAQEADKTNLHTHLGSHQGIHHAQPYHQTSTPGTPSMLHKREYQPHHNHNNHQPPPVPPHQNNNHHLHNPYHQSTTPHTTPAMEQHRRTLERSARNLHYQMPPNTQTSPHDSSMNIEGLPTRIPSLRRTRRTSGNANNNNGGVGIPIVPGSPRVQRSPMPARAMIKRNRLGSHNDNISSGSLNSIEV